MQYSQAMCRMKTYCVRLQEIGDHKKGIGGKKTWLEFDLAFLQIAVVGTDIIVLSLCIEEALMYQFLFMSFCYMRKG